MTTHIIALFHQVSAEEVSRIYNEPGLALDRGDLQGELVHTNDILPFHPVHLLTKISVASGCSGKPNQRKDSKQTEKRRRKNHQKKLSFMENLRRRQSLILTENVFQYVVRCSRTLLGPSPKGRECSGWLVRVVLMKEKKVNSRPHPSAFQNTTHPHFRGGERLEGGKNSLNFLRIVKIEWKKKKKKRKRNPREKKTKKNERH